MGNGIIHGHLLFSSTYEHTAAGDIAALTIANASVVLVNKTSGAATAVTLPALPAATFNGCAIIIVDAKGDAASNNITITPASGLINGAATYVISENYGSVCLIWDGTNYTAWAGSKASGSQALGQFTTVNGTTINVTTLNVAGITTDSDVATLAATGTVIGNAAALSHAITVVTGADDAKGVILPTAVAGKRLEVYSSQATNGLKIYPPVNGTINGGSANTAIVIEGLTLARFVGTSATNWASQFTVNA